MTKKLGRYEILEEISQGDFANVYRALDVELEREVALKELKPTLLGNLTWVKQFRREARTIVRLDHPNIVPVYDVYETQPRLFVVMRWVNGPSLEQALAEQGRLPWAEALEIVTAMAAGLDYAHLQGILHRDLKPGNILFDPERVAMLTDFGMARLVEVAGASATATSSVVGTPPYMAPEIWEGQGTTRQADVYALGCILYEMLIGEKLFSEDTTSAVMLAHFKPLTLPQNWPPDVPLGVAEILKKALAHHPADRYVMAGEIAQALAAIASVTPNGFHHQAESSGSPSSQKFKSLIDEVKPDPANFQGEILHPVTVGDDNGMGTTATNKWKVFWRHFGAYAIIMALLMSIYFLTDSGGYPWFIWPGLIWGVIVAIHLWATKLSEDRERNF